MGWQQCREVPVEMIDCRHAELQRALDPCGHRNMAGIGNTDHVGSLGNGIELV
jgi:hypothetical protein